MLYEFVTGMPPFNADTPEVRAPLVAIPATQSTSDQSIQQCAACHNKKDLSVSSVLSKKRKGKICCVSAQEIFDNILNRCIEWPESGMSEACQDLIDRLLQTDPELRLGHCGTLEIKAHRWFEGLDWDNLAQAKAAFIPHLESDTDTRYFAPKEVSSSGFSNLLPSDVPSFHRMLFKPCVGSFVHCLVHAFTGVPAQHDNGHPEQRGCVAVLLLTSL